MFHLISASPYKGRAPTRGLRAVPLQGGSRGLAPYPTCKTGQ